MKAALVWSFLLRLLRRTAVFLATGLTLLALYCWYAGIAAILEGRPDHVELKELTIKRPLGNMLQPVIIGRDSLLQRDAVQNMAEPRHLSLSYGADGWSLKNVASARRLTLSYRGANPNSAPYVLDSARYKLAERQVVRSAGIFGPTAVAMEKSDSGVLELRVTASPALGQPAVTLQYTATLEGGRPRLIARSGQDLPQRCGTEGSVDLRALERLNRDLRVAFGLATDTLLFLLGGELSCNDGAEPPRIAVPGLVSGTLVILEQGSELFLAPGPTAGGAALRSARASVIENDSHIQQLGALHWPLRDGLGRTLETLTLGRTVYEVRRGNATGDLILAPRSNSTWYWKHEQKLLPILPANALIERRLAENARLSARFEWDKLLDLVLVERLDTKAGSGLGFHGMRLSNRMVIPLIAGGVVLIMGLGGLLAGAWQARSERPFSRFLTGLVPLAFSTASIAAAALLLQLDSAAHLASGHLTSLALVIFSWLLATLAVWLTLGRTTIGPLLWLFVTILAASGNVIVAQLAFGGSGMRWVAYFERSLAPLALFAAGIVLALAIARERWHELLSRMASGPVLPSPRAIREGQLSAWFIRFLPILLAILFLATWVLIGSEEGVSGLLQPSEYVKVGILYLVAVTLVSAYTNTVVDIDAVERSVEVIVMLLGVAFLLAGFVVVPVFRHDYSPLLIMGLTAAIVSLCGGLIGIVNRLFLRLRRQRRRPPLELVGQRRSRSFLGRIVGIDNRSRLIWRRLTDLPMLARATARRLFYVATLLVIASFGGAAWYISTWERLSNEERIVAADTARGGTFGRFYNRVLSYFDLEYRAADARVVIVNYPDEGRQVRLSRHVIASAPCWGPAGLADTAPNQGQEDITWLKWAAHGALRLLDESLAVMLGPVCSGIASKAPALGTPNESALHGVPVVQNDFIGSFVIARFGMVPAAGIMLAQLGLVAMCYLIAFRIYRWQLGREDDRARRHLLSLLCLGAGTLFGLQWIISWANVFGLLPVMGQPMTFIAAAGSHLVLMALPLVVIVLVALRLDQEEPAQPLGAEPPAMRWWLRRRF